jgi:hypothetical protein
MQIAVSATYCILLDGFIQWMQFGTWLFCWFSCDHVKLTFSNINPHLNLIKRSLPHNRSEADNLFLLELRCYWTKFVFSGWYVLCNLSVLLLNFVPLQDELQKASEMHKKRGGVKVTWSETCCSGSQVFALSECPSCSVIKNIKMSKLHDAIDDDSRHFTTFPLHKTYPFDEIEFRRFFRAWFGWFDTFFSDNSLHFARHEHHQN